MARFDDRHTATVYAASQDPLVAPDYYRIVIHKRVGKELTWKGDWYFDTPVPAPGPNGTGSAFALLCGALRFREAHTADDTPQDLGAPSAKVQNNQCV